MPYKTLLPRQQPQWACSVVALAPAVATAPPAAARRRSNRNAIDIHNWMSSRMRGARWGGGKSPRPSLSFGSGSGLLGDAPACRLVEHTPYVFGSLEVGADVCVCGTLWTVGS